MIDPLEFRKTFSICKTIMDKGLRTKNVIAKNQQSNVVFEWWEKTNASLCNGATTRFKAKQAKSKDLYYEEGIFLLWDTVLFSFKFDDNGIEFYYNFPDDLDFEEMDFDDWCESYLFDVRVQSAISTLLKILLKYDDYEE